VQITVFLAHIDESTLLTFGLINAMTGKLSKRLKNKVERFLLMDVKS